MKNETYHKIHSPFKRDTTIKNHPLIMYDWATPEFEMLQHIMWYGYEKIDGMNIKVIFTGDCVCFEGKTEAATLPLALFEVLIDMFPLELLKEAFPYSKSTEPDSKVILYGEGFGYKINSGGKYLSHRKVSFILFDVKVDRWWLNSENVTEVAAKLNIDRVPFICTSTLLNFFNLIKDGFKSSFGDFYAEGIVVQPVVQLFDRAGKRIITKIKHKDFYKGDFE